MAPRFRANRNGILPADLVELRDTDIMLLESLTARERGIVILYALNDLRLKDVAERFNIAPSTVSAHFANAQRKLGIRDGKRGVRNYIRRAHAEGSLPRTDGELLGNVPYLTPREREIADIAGTTILSLEEIGSRLGISRKTVQINLNHVYFKFGVEDRPEFVNAYAQAKTKVTIASGA